MKITPVILCGGSGTRLWPRSRKVAPKPFLPLVGKSSLFAATVERTSDPARFDPPVVVAGAAHVELIEGQLPQGSSARLIVEPEAKNTAAAIALAALALPEDTVMLVCPSDHHIADSAALVAAADAAAALARDGHLVALAIAPTRPETGYGYIRRGEALAGGFRVARFVEKPALAAAEAMLAEGGYSWNGGIFAFRAGTYLSELENLRPDLAGAARASFEAGNAAGARFHPDPVAFARIDSESVDYAVMEGTERAAMVEADMGWSDIGNWQSLREAREADEADEAGNVVRGPADLIDCRAVMVESDGPRVSVVGLEGVIVVVDKGEVLVTGVHGAANVGKLKGASEQ